MGNVGSDNVTIRKHANISTSGQFLNRKHKNTLIKSQSNLYNPSSLSFNLKHPIAPYDSRSSKNDDFFSGDSNYCQANTFNNSSFKQQKNSNKKKRSLSTPYLSSPFPSAASQSQTNFQYNLDFIRPENAFRNLNSFCGRFKFFIFISFRISLIFIYLLLIKIFINFEIT